LTDLYLRKTRFRKLSDLQEGKRLKEL